jgi:hypothetical protein
MRQRLVICCMLLFIASASPTFTLSNSNYAGVQFQKPNLFPQTALTLKISGGYYFNNSAVCTDFMSNYAVAGPGWIFTMVTPTSIGYLQAAPGEPNVSASRFSVIVLGVVADDDFRSQGEYTIRVPWNCTADYALNASSPRGIIPGTTNFTITQGRRSSLGRLTTFIVLLSAGTCMLAALLASSMPLLLTQLQCLLTAPACGPIAVQEEFEVLQYLLVPFDFRSLFGTLGLTPASRLLLVATALILIVCIMEGVRYIVETRLVCKDLRIPVDEFWLPLRSVNQGIPDFIVDPPQLLMESGRSGSGENLEAQPATSEGLNGNESFLLPSKPADERRAHCHNFIHDYRGAPIPPHYCFVILLALMLGVTHVSIVAAFVEKSGVVWSALALGLTLLFAVGPVAISMSITRDHSVFWCPYSTQRGSLPAIVQPDGVWGPNATREAYAPFLSCWRKGCKGMSPFAYLLCLLAAICSSITTSTTSNALFQTGILSFSVALLFVLCLAVRPFRMPLSNILCTGALATTFCSSVLQSTFNSRNGAGVEEVYISETQFMSRYSNGLLICGAVSGLLLAVAGVCEFAVRLWEVRRGRERRAGREGEKHRRQRKLQGSIRASRIERQQFQEIVKDLMEEVVLFAQKGAQDDDNDDEELETSAAQKRSGRARAASVWRKGHQEVEASDAHPPSLADYLVQDFDSLPLETREEMLLADEREDGRNTRARIKTMVRQNPRDMDRSYVHHKLPPFLSTMSVEVDKNSKDSKPDYVL